MSPGGVTLGLAGRRHQRTMVAAPTLAAAVVGLGLLLGWRGTDWAAQLYRIDNAWTIWDSQWYGGHWTLDYSVVYPPLASLIGVGTVAVLSAAGAALPFAPLIAGRFGAAGRPASMVFAASII